MLAIADTEIENAAAEIQLLTLKALYVLLASHPPALQQAHESNGYGLIMGVAEGRILHCADDDQAVAIYSEVRVGPENSLLNDHAAH